MVCHGLTHEISERRRRCLPMCPRSKSGTGRPCLQQQLTEHKRNSFASPSKNAVEKKTKKNKKRKAIAKAIATRYKQAQKKLQERIKLFPLHANAKTC